MTRPVKGILPDAIDPEPQAAKIRQPDPPTAAEAAMLRAQAVKDSVPPVQQILDQLKIIADRLVTAAPIPAPPPIPPTPPPPAAPPPERKLQVNAKTGELEIPCSLSAAELASTEPSEQTLRMWRAAQEKFEAEARKQAQQRPDLPPNFKVDFMGRVVPR
jgi:hypothetical protein